MNILFTINKKDEEQNSIKQNVENKVLILSCGTGGGHNSAALAIQENLIEKGIRADFIEYLDIISPKIKNHINHLYIKSTYGNGKVFKAVYHLGELYQKLDIKSPVYQLNKMNRKKLYKYIKEHGYKYIVTTHLFAAQALTAIKKEYPIHFMQIATDYVCIPFWEETDPDYFVIPSKELEKDFLDKGIKKEKLLPLGIPVAKQYRVEYEKNDSKKILGLDIGKKYILILTGSMGFGNITTMLKKLLDSTQKINYIISCGNNEKLFKTIQEEYKNNKRVIAIPFTKKLSEYMKSSEIILTKPGGLTTTEVATLRKPFIHTMPIPGCENYNANFFSNRKMSIKCDTMEEVIENTKKLINDINLQKEMMTNQEKYIDRDTTDKITDVIIREFLK